MRLSLLVILLATCIDAWAQPGCGELVTLSTHDGSATRYSLAGEKDAKATLILLVGGGGDLNLDDRGCPVKWRGNALVRMRPMFHAEGFATALVDAPSDHLGGDGLAGFRSAKAHAEDLAKVIADLRGRAQRPVWVVGTSRGTISAANAAARLSGPAAADGVVLTSALTAGTFSAKPWTTNTVFDLPLEEIRIPLLVVGHALDACRASPASSMNAIVARTHGSRQQVVLVTGGPGRPRPGVDVCEALAPHGYLEQEQEVVAGIARFIKGGEY